MLHLNRFWKLVQFIFKSANYVKIEMRADVEALSGRRLSLCQKHAVKHPEAQRNEKLSHSQCKRTIYSVCSSNCNAHC